MTALGGSIVLLGAVCRDGRAGEATTSVEVVRGLVADLRAGKSLDALGGWWDGEHFARRVFADSWDRLGKPERAELGRLSAWFCAKEPSRLFSELEKKRKAGSDVDVGPAMQGPDEQALASVRVTISGTMAGRKEATTLVFLTTKGAGPARVADWRYDEPKNRSLLSEELVQVRRRLGGGSQDPLVWAWANLRMETPPADSVVFAIPPAPAPEWAVRDLPPIDLARVPGAEPDVRVAVAETSRFGPRVVIHVTRSRSVFHRLSGRRSPLTELALAGASDEQRSKGLETLRPALAAAARAPGLVGEDGASDLGLLVRADRSARWEDVYGVASLASDLAPNPAVSTRAVGFVCEAGTDGRACVLRVETNVLVPSVAVDWNGAGLPALAGGAAAVRMNLFRIDAEDPSHATTKLTLRGPGDGPRWELVLPHVSRTGGQARDDAATAAYDASFAKLTEGLRERKAAAPAGQRFVAVLLMAPPKAGPVPAEDVLRALQCLRDAGVSLGGVVSVGRARSTGR